MPSSGDGLERVGAGIRQLGRLMSSRRASSALALAAGVDLSQQAIEVLRSIDRDAPTAVADLARTAHMDAGAVSRQLRVLEDRRLVTRRQSPSHRSIVLVEPTARGRKLIGRVEAVRTQHLDDALAEWTEAERSELGRLLVRLVADLQTTAFRAG
ncbi:MAG: MarR family winged helix-turn-helix transcriptional regulator [Acidimicrobiales bacterium]